MICILFRLAYISQQNDPRRTRGKAPEGAHARSIDPRLGPCNGMLRIHVEVAIISRWVKRMAREDNTTFILGYLCIVVDSRRWSFRSRSASKYSTRAKKYSFHFFSDTLLNNKADHLDRSTAALVLFGRHMKTLGIVTSELVIWLLIALGCKEQLFLLSDSAWRWSVRQEVRRRWRVLSRYCWKGGLRRMSAGHLKGLRKRAYGQIFEYWLRNPLGTRIQKAYVHVRIIFSIIFHVRS